MTDPINEDEIRVVANSMKVDLKQLAVRTEAGRFLLVAFTVGGDSVKEPLGDDHIAEVPEALRGLLIRQCRSGKVDFVELKEAARKC